jgi:hypothetical protein
MPERLRAEQGFRVLASDDHKQCQDIEAGLEILTARWRNQQRQHETAELFREGCAAAALAMKRENSTAEHRASAPTTRPLQRGSFLNEV